MQITPAIILIALGGLALITQRNRWIVLGALLAQWAGMAWQIAPLAASSSTTLVEIVTAVACCGILFLTLRNLGQPQTNPQSTIRNPQSQIADQIWLWAIALVAGVAGYALARLYPLGGNEQDLTAFYWLVLPAMLALVVEGARDPVKLGAGLLALLNAGLLLVYTLSATSPSVALLGLASLGRLALAAISGYTWLFLKSTYSDLDLNIPFDLRDSKVATQTALALVTTDDRRPTTDDRRRTTDDRPQTTDSVPLHGEGDIEDVGVDVLLEEEVDDDA